MQKKRSGNFFEKLTEFLSDYFRGLIEVYKVLIKYTKRCVFFGLVAASFIYPSVKTYIIHHAKELENVNFKGLDDDGIMRFEMRGREVIIKCKNTLYPKNTDNTQDMLRFAEYKHYVDKKIAKSENVSLIRTGKNCYNIIANGVDITQELTDGYLFIRKSKH